MQGWERGKSRLADVVFEQTERCLEVYRKDPSRVHQDANNERRISSGGYQDRQLEELLQNAVDAASRGGERVEVLLTSQTLYVANDGEPFDEKGLLSIMASDISTKGDEHAGKFGIGFKSVLAVSDTPKILSRSVSFGFDKEWSEKMLRGEGHDASAYPTTRLAQLLDPAALIAADPHLQQLAEWASTIVVVPLNTSCEDISKRLQEFPAEFVLFSPHIRTATLRNLAERDPGRKENRQAVREITVDHSNEGHVVLHAGTEEKKWRIVEEFHRPSSDALVDGGHVAAREKLTVRYAVSLPPGSADGEFWAYFPTGDRTTLSGQVNAPWKLSDDRTRLLPGKFNEEILRGVLPRLVARALFAFEGAESAGAALDVMPARGREARGWADDFVNAPLIQHLRRVPSLPDSNGRLRVPSELLWVGDVPLAWLEAWNASPGAPKDKWVHLEANRTPERRHKVGRLLETGGQSEGNAGIDKWLEGLLGEGTVEASATAIHLAAKIVDHMPNVSDVDLRVRAQKGISNARIVRLEGGAFKAPTKGRVFVRVDGDDRSGVDFVDPELADLPGVRESLRKLGIVVMDRSGELHALLTQAKQPDGLRTPAAIWPKVWEILREIPAEAGLQILREDLGVRLDRTVRVKTAAGTWVRPSDAFLGGSIVPVDGTRDRERLIDPVYHRSDADLLREVGAVAAPAWRHDAPREQWLEEYEEAMRGHFIERQTGSKPDRLKVLVDGSAPPWPLQPLMKMSDASRAAATEFLLAHGKPEPWTVRHTSNPSYGSIRVSAPEIWFIRNHGLLPTEFGHLPPKRVLQAGEGIDPKILPAYETTDRMAETLGLLDDVEALSPNDWADAKRVADGWVRSDDDDRRRTEFYTWLPGHLAPEKLIVRVGRARQYVEPQNIGVTADRSVYDTMLDAQVPALFVSDPDDVDRFIDLWEARQGSDLLQEEVVVETAGESSFLTDVFPPLKVRLYPEDQDLCLQPCSRLVKMVATPHGQLAQQIPARREGSTLLVTATSPEQRLAQVSGLLGLDLDRQKITKILSEMEEAAVNQHRQNIKTAQNDNERLIVAVGIEALRRIVPSQALSALEERPEGISDQDVAELARAVHGVSILKQLRPTLEEKGLEPPKEWAGRQLTREWVRQLGFPLDWAGFPTSSRPAVEVIDGPAVLSSLHGYQVQVTERIAALLRGIGKDRGMVSLPTGAGKTRVAVEALVNGVREGDISLDQPIVWIAQTDELCEQAAEAWTYVWRAVGPQIVMRLGRLWASNEITEEPGTFQVVVATIDKLRSIQGKPGSNYDWLRNPAVVVVDEAHASLATSYTQVLDWLGRSSRSRSEADRKPLIGLTATPFKGNSEAETTRLVARYDGNRLDRGSFRNADDPYTELQEMQVLARVRQELIDGTDVHLTDADMQAIEQTKRLPSAVTDRLGGDLQRTLRIVDSIAQLPDDWTVLAFAPSLENARVLAALLSHRGIPAVSVSADTEAGARRHYVDEFKAGRLRVLTNYGVFTQGFDAPMVQAVYVTRPTFSPNVYQQMIGRGLRGPKNGGSEEVLIVNVRDNFQNYGELLAFNEFEYLWTQQ